MNGRKTRLLLLFSKTGNVVKNVATNIVTAFVDVLSVTMLSGQTIRMTITEGI